MENSFHLAYPTFQGLIILKQAHATSWYLTLIELYKKFKIPVILSTLHNFMGMWGHVPCELFALWVLRQSYKHYLVQSILSSLHHSVCWSRNNMKILDRKTKKRGFVAESLIIRPITDY